MGNYFNTAQPRPQRLNSYRDNTMEMNPIVEDHGQDYPDCDCPNNNNCLHRAIQDKNKDLE